MNAVAHRDYEEAGAKVIVEVFANRVVFSSPGLPPGNPKDRTNREWRGSVPLKEPTDRSGFDMARVYGRARQWHLPDARESGASRIRAAAILIGRRRVHRYATFARGVG